MRVVLRRLFARPTSALGTTLLLIFAVLAVFGPWLAPYEANEQILRDAGQKPSQEHWFGADHLGRDVFSRVILGAREILFLAGLGSFLAVCLGTVFGLISGYRGGWLDETLMRVFDSFLAIPVMVLALLLLGTVGAESPTLWIILAVVYTPIVARVVRSVVLSVKNRGFVEAARLRGESIFYILLREILPSLFPVLSVEAAMRFSYAIFLVASLGFLGLGVQPPSPDWGLMVKEARLHVSQTPWAMFFPAMAIVLLVIGVNLTTDGLKRLLLSPENNRQ